MREDSVGFFWEDLADKRGRATYARPIPAVPDNGWTAPKEFPRLADEKLLAIDIESRDTALLEKGPGWRRDGEDHAHIVGLAVGTPSGGRWYFPMRHTIAPEQNLEPESVLAWARDNLCTPGQTKVGANIAYDIDGLWSEGVPVTGPFLDVQHAEALIDENRFTYNLESLARRYCGEGKRSDDLRDWIDRAYGSGDAYRADVWRAPPCLVGPYAEGDVDLPLRILEKQLPLLEADGLCELFAIEEELIGPIVRMRQRGVRVDLAYAQRLDDRLSAGIVELDARLASLAGMPVDVNSANSLSSVFEKIGVRYPKTAAGNPSFAKWFLGSCEHPVAQLIVERRALAKYRDTFVRGYVLDLHVNGRLHALFHPLKTDENGTVSGRFSSSLPNLQNIPARDPIWGPMLRALFVPEDGELWLRHDWSQIEYRFLAHYARGPTGAIVREKYTADPTTDFHEMTLDLVAPVAQWDVSTPENRKQWRKPVKNINFGLCYGMGKGTLAVNLGLDIAEAEQLFESYHTAVPFVHDTFKAASNTARDRGYIKTVLNRRARFPLWEPLFSEGKALPHTAAVEKYGHRIVRAFTHKALNRLLQGSAADLMKLAMRDMYRAGVQDVLGDMLLTCHDETGHSMPQTVAGREAADEVRRIMEQCLRLRVPIKADQSTGSNWGECK